MTDYTTTGIYYDLITISGTYTFSVDGAQGGNSSVEFYEKAGGQGAEISGDIYLTAGTTLEIVVGGAGSSSNFSGGGGGGGSFVFETISGSSLEKLAIAGGGGGAGYDGIGGGAQTGETGGNGGGEGGGAGGKNGAAGAGGSHGGGGGYTGGAGGNGGAANGKTTGQTFGGGAGGSTGGSKGGFGGGGGGGHSGGGGGGGFGGGGGGGYGDYGSGGGGGGSYDADLTDLSTTGAKSGNGEVMITLCYLHGTRILTPTGATAVEALSIGDRVVTRFGGIQRIKFLGRQSFSPEFLANNLEKWPVCIHAGALADGVPARDLYVSPGHSLLLGDVLVLASNLLNGVTITQTPPEADVNYVQIELARHDCVLAEGAWAETFADAPGLRAKFHNAAEFYALYPDEAPADALKLCAARPERGEALNVALTAVAARAVSDIVPGRLEGYVEQAGGWRISGWAFDPAHPALPVVLEICAGGKFLGRVAACETRDDLAAAGKGSGRCAFSFTSPVRLTADVLTGLSVRRAVDHVALEMAGQREVA